MKWAPVAVLGCLAVYVILFAIATINSQTSPIKVILPEGYTGTFSIVKDRIAGEDIVLREGFWVFETASGILRVKDDGPFYKWHGEVVVYSTGLPAKVKHLGTSAGMISSLVSRICGLARLNPFNPLNTNSPRRRSAASTSLLAAR